MSEESPDASAPEAEVDEHDETEPATDEVEAPPDVESEDDDAAQAEPARVEREPWEPTGHASVDRALASLDVLDETSVHDHVAVFEEAHRTLRRALDEAGDEAGDEETGVPASGLG
ncbi:MAG: hypothetical protein JWO46_2236 [Nocardioidaceae bacterium]|nr:hypothetical protein [Nocardioidaceae bacterium]